jgi:ABC-type glycerol-3-phosphate transport system substrate-binding protein
MPPAEFTVGMNVTTLFSMQRVACLVSGRWEVSSFRQLSFDWDVAYIPAFKGADGTDAELQKKNSYSGSVGYAVNNKLSGDKKMAAVKLVEYIASKEGQEILAATGFQIPVYEALGMDENFIKYESSLGPQNYQVFIQSAKNQPAGLWQYRPSQRWKVLGFDTECGPLFNFQNPMSLDTFIDNVRAAVNANL